MEFAKERVLGIIQFLINTSHDGFAALPERFEKVARLIGASTARVIFAISVPISGCSIISVMLMMFAHSMCEFGALV